MESVYKMDLKELLGEELFKQVSEKLGDKKVAVVSDGNWIPKDKFDSLNNEKKTYKETADKLKADLDEMSNKAKGNEELTQQIDGLKGQLEESQTKIKDISISSAIEKELVKANAKFPDLLMGKIDKSKIEILNDGTIKGLEDQITPMKESYKDLFGETKIVGGDPNRNNNNPNGDPDTSAMSDDEYFAHMAKEQK